MENNLEKAKELFFQSLEYQFKGDLKQAKLILEDLKSRNELMFFYSPSMDEIFKKNFFVFLNENQKKELVNKLYENQPFISEISSKPRLQGFNNLLSLMTKQSVIGMFIIIANQAFATSIFFIFRFGQSSHTRITIFNQIIYLLAIFYLSQSYKHI